MRGLATMQHRGSRSRPRSVPVGDLQAAIQQHKELVELHFDLVESNSPEAEDLLQRLSDARAHLSQLIEAVHGLSHAPDSSSSRCSSALSISPRTDRSASTPNSPTHGRSHSQRTHHPENSGPVPADFRTPPPSPHRTLRHSTPPHTTVVEPTAERFFERNTRWASARDAAVARVRAEMKQSEAADCTFAPTLNASTAAVLQFRTATGADSQSVPHRLFAQAAAADRRLAELSRRVEASESRECRFHPKISERSRSLCGADKRGGSAAGGGVPNRLARRRTTAARLAAAAAEAELSRRLPPADVSVVSSSAVRAYLGMDAHERLYDTRVVRPSRAGEGGSVGGRNGTGRSHSRGRSRDPKEAELGWRDFLTRQERDLLNRAQKSAVLSRRHQPPARPTITRRAQSVVSRSGKDFMSRRAADLERRSVRAATAALDATASEPRRQLSVNRSSSEKGMQSGRSAAASQTAQAACEALYLHAQERQRRLDAIRIQAKVEGEAHEADHPFQPSVSTRSRKIAAKSTAPSVRDPKAYSDAIVARRERIDYERQLLRSAYDAAEMAECTFRPKVHGVPPVVAAIGRILREAKAQASSEAVEDLS